MSSLNRLPPYSHESEAAFLGSCLINPDAIDAGLDENLTQRDFHNQDNALIWQAMVGLRDAGKAIDFVTLSDRLSKTNSGVEGSYVMSLISDSPLSMNAAYYAQIIKDKAIRRGVIEAASRINDFAYDENDDIDSMLDKADNVLRNAKERAPQTGSDPGPSDIIARMEGEIAAGPETRIPKLNQITSGMVPGHLWIVGGFSSTGKSAFGVNLVEDVVLGKGAVMIASTEMSQEQYMLRLLSLTSQVPQRKIRYGGMTTDESAAYQRAREYWRGAKVRIFDDLYNLTRIRRVAQRVKRETGLDVLMVDFIQNIHETGDEVKDARMAAIKLQALAKELDTCVVAMSQISNSQAIAQNETGAMGNYYAFKGSGAIKDAADLAIMLDRDRVNLPNVLWANVVKNRHDSLARIGLWFDLPTGTVKPMTPDEELDANPNAGRKSRRQVDVNADRD